VFVFRQDDAFHDPNAFVSGDLKTAVALGKKPILRPWNSSPNTTANSQLWVIKIIDIARRANQQILPISMNDRQ